jgi:hypothetical protein
VFLSSLYYFPGTTSFQFNAESKKGNGTGSFIFPLYNKDSFPCPTARLNDPNQFVSMVALVM